MDRPNVLVQGNRSAPVLSAALRMRAKEIIAIPGDSQEAGKVSSQHDFVHFLPASCHEGNRAKRSQCSVRSLAQMPLPNSSSIAPYLGDLGQVTHPLCSHRLLQGLDEET